MELIYFQTAGSFGYVDSEDNLPPGAQIITQAQYEQLLADWQAEQEAVAAAERAECEQRFLDAYAAYRALGLPPEPARSAAASAGCEPVDFDPTILLPV